MRKVLILWIFLILIPHKSVAQISQFRLSSDEVLQGEILMIQKIDKEQKKFLVNFLGRNHESVNLGNRQSVILGVHFQAEPGNHVLTLKSDLSGGATVYDFSVIVREVYPILKSSPPERNPEVQKKIDLEAENKKNALQNMSHKIDSMLFFAQPISPVKLNAFFGDVRCRDRRGKRKFNCRYHLGLDYRSAFDIFHQKPEPATAINSGRVILAVENIMDGKLVVIDHGNGISSEYLHLSKFLVKEGDMIKRGQKIGITGKTGATDAIHLHLTIKMDYGKTIVDPEVFLKNLSK